MDDAEADGGVGGVLGEDFFVVLLCGALRGSRCDRGGSSFQQAEGSEGVDECLCGQCVGDVFRDGDEVAGFAEDVAGPGADAVGEEHFFADDVVWRRRSGLHNTPDGFVAGGEGNGAGDAVGAFEGVDVGRMDGGGQHFDERLAGLGRRRGEGLECEAAERSAG